MKLQVKNGPIDFQPREPFHPLFGAMPRTQTMLELQITQEYLGQGTHLAYLAPLFKETLDADTYADGPQTTVAHIVDGSVMAAGVGHLFCGIAAVANIGDDRNWCGHPFAQANWYAFGRLAWDHGLAAADIADEWIRMTFTTDERFVAPVKEMMLASREAVVDYMTPLGLHHIMAEGHHHGPGPWVDVKDAGRADWTSVYYHRADAAGIGFDWTATGSNAVALYRSPLRERFADLATCPENLLLWFHHVRWDHKLSSGRTLWDELCHRYSAGVDAVRAMQATWDGLAAFVDRRAPRPRAPAARDPGAGGALVAQRLPALLPDLLAAAPARGARAAGGDAGRVRRAGSAAPHPNPLPHAAPRGEGTGSGGGGADEGRHGAGGQQGGELPVDDGHRALRLQVRALRGQPGRHLRDRAARDREVLLEVVVLLVDRDHHDAAARRIVERADDRRNPATAASRRRARSRGARTGSSSRARRRAAAASCSPSARRCRRPSRASATSSATR